MKRLGSVSYNVHRIEAGLSAEAVDRLPAWPWHRVWARVRFRVCHHLRSLK